MMTRILILGGTTEARELAARLAAMPGLAVTLSLAGRTREPAAQAAPVRVGGFGGAAGLAGYLRTERVGLMVDATHPFAARISANAAEAAKAAGVPILALRRPEWQRRAGDRWTEVSSIADAVFALGPAPRRVFLAIGRREAAVFEAAPQHFYLVRSVDPVDPPPVLPHAHYILSRGPFAFSGELDLLRDHRIDAVVAKNSGGEATYAKIEAARQLGIEIVMVRRPPMPDVPMVATVEAAVAHVSNSP
jgi:precorrin-6A/cobalt-precorrin-6A reductase